MWKGFSRALQNPMLSVSMVAIAALFGAGPALGSPQATAAGSGPIAELPPVETLRLKDTTVFSSAAPNAMRSGTQCDSQGDAFVQFASLVGFPAHIDPSSSIAEVILDGKRIVAYGTSPLSESDYPHARVTSFGVLPDGKVYALIFTRGNAPSNGPRPDPQYYVERFKDDGTEDSMTPIHAPPGVAHWFADQLGAFPDGNFLIVGTSTESTERPSAGSWQPFTAVYDPSGRFVSEVTLANDIVNNFDKGGTGRPRGTAGAQNQASPPEASKPQQYFEVAISTGGLVNGPDGNVWILRASNPVRLYAIDSSGRVTQRLRFSSPVPGLMPFDFGFAGPGQIFLDFVRPPATPSVPSGPSELLAIFNTISQQFEALYTLPEDANKGLNALACSDRNGGFLYLGGTPDNRFAVFDYAAR